MGSSFSVNTIFGAKDRMSPVFKKIGQGAMGLKSIIGGILSANLIQKGFEKLKQGVTSFITEASKIEDATAAFTPLMGGAEKARLLVDRLNKEAATTPYQFEGIANVAKQLLPVMNGDINRTAETFRMLGDTAGGSMEKLDSITRGYVKALLKGKPDMEALNMIAEAGVPIFSEMAKSMGIAQDQLFAMSKKGQLTNDMLTKTFQNMTKEGGIFFNGMTIASQTYSGMMSTLQDNIALTSAAIGGAFMENIKNGVRWAINITGKIQEWVNANKDLIKSKIDAFLLKAKQLIDKFLPPITKLIKQVFELGRVIVDVVIGAFKNLTAPIGGAAGALELLKNVIGFVTGFISSLVAGIQFLSPILKIFIPLISAWVAVQWLLNAAMAANPIGLIITAVTLLIAGIGLLVKNFDTVKKVVMDVFGSIGKFISDVFGWIGGVFNDFIETKIKPIIKIFEFLALVVGEMLKKAFESLWKFIEPIIKGIGDFFNGIGDFFVGVGKGISDFFTGGGKQKEPEAPNKREAEARKKIEFQGNLNIAGAPAGSTFDAKTKGAPPIRYTLLGAN